MDSIMVLDLWGPLSQSGKLFLKPQGCWHHRPPRKTHACVSLLLSVHSSGYQAHVLPFHITPCPTHSKKHQKYRPNSMWKHKPISALKARQDPHPCKMTYKTAGFCFSCKGVKLRLNYTQLLSTSSFSHICCCKKNKSLKTKELSVAVEISLISFPRILCCYTSHTC